MTFRSKLASGFLQSSRYSVDCYNFRASSQRMKEVNMEIESGDKIRGFRISLDASNKRDGTMEALKFARQLLLLFRRIASRGLRADRSDVTDQCKTAPANTRSARMMNRWGAGPT